MLVDEVQHRGHRLRRILGIGHRVALTGAGEDHREVELLFARVQRREEVKGLVDGEVGVAAGAVDLVDDQEDLEPSRDRLLGDEARLRHRPLEGVDDEQGRVDHVEDALDLAAEVCVSGGVDEVDPGVAVLERGRLRGDRDPALPLEVVAIHRPVGVGGSALDRTGCREESVDERGLAVVDVGDDREVSNVCGAHGGQPPQLSPPAPAMQGLFEDLLGPHRRRRPRPRRPRESDPRPGRSPRRRPAPRSPAEANAEARAAIVDLVESVARSLSAPSDERRRGPRPRPLPPEYGS